MGDKMKVNKLFKCIKGHFIESNYNGDLIESYIAEGTVICPEITPSEEYYEEIGNVDGSTIGVYGTQPAYPELEELSRPPHPGGC